MTPLLPTSRRWLRRRRVHLGLLRYRSISNQVEPPGGGTETRGDSFRIERTVVSLNFRSAPVPGLVNPAAPDAGADRPTAAGSGPGANQLDDDRASCRLEFHGLRHRSFSGTPSARSHRSSLDPRGPHRSSHATGEATRGRLARRGPSACAALASPFRSARSVPLARTLPGLSALEPVTRLGACPMAARLALGPRFDPVCVPAEPRAPARADG